MLVGTLDAFRLPVCPEDPVFVKSQAKRVRKLAANQHLQNENFINYLAVDEITVIQSECKGDCKY